MVSSLTALVVVVGVAGLALPRTVASAGTGSELEISTDPVMLSASPFRGATLFVDPASNARHTAAGLRASAPVRAELFDRIGDHAQTDWFGDWIPAPELRAAVADRVGTIRRARALPVLVAYAIPARDCGGHSAGGVGTAAAYRAWIRELAAGLDGRPAAVILEPDALAQMTPECLGSEAAVDQRATLLKEAVQTLTSRGAGVYLDAGNSSWLPATEAAARLRRAGIDQARGFALNVSNYRTTAESVSYGRAVAAALGGGVPFVVDTSRNGRGPAPDAEWCNPPERALGPRPSVHPTSGVDAYLWIKRPGESDGSCNGGPPAGDWWPRYAEDLAARAPW